jgi:4-amino-4-deoxy-L-arabinose transferase-like glycosyltransferase
MVLVGGVAAALRLILILAYSPVLTTDSSSYLDLAHRLGALNLHGSTGTRTPGYPALLLALGYSPVAVWCVQAALGVVATLLLYRLVRRLGGSGWAATAAAIAYAVDLEVLAVERQVMTETLASFLILVAASLTVATTQAERKRWAIPIWTGVTLCYLCLVRPDSLAIAVYFALAIGISQSVRWAREPRQRLRLAVRYGAAILLAPLLALVAWAGVNRATIGVTSVSTVIGFNMIDHVARYVNAEPGPNYPITSAYVAARVRREAHTSNLANLSADAEPGMQRASHLTAARLSGRLLSIALGVIARHPFAYLASSLKQWPRFWLPPNYPYQFTGGSGSSFVHLAWKFERALKLLVAAAFLLLCVSDIVRRLRRRKSVLSLPSAVLAGVVAVGTFPPTLLAFGDTGRYGYTYYPLILAVTIVATEPLIAATFARRPWLRDSPRSAST